MITATVLFRRENKKLRRLQFSDFKRKIYSKPS